MTQNFLELGIRMMFIFGIYTSTVTATEEPFLQDISFRSVFQYANVVSVAAWEKIPFASLSNRQSIIHQDSDCFFALSNGLYSATSQTHRNKTNLINPYLPWETLQSTISGEGMLLNSHTKDFSFFVVTSNNISGLKLSPRSNSPPHCGKIVSSKEILKANTEWGELLAVSSSESHIFVATTQGISKVHIQSGAVSQIVLSDKSVSAMYFVSAWNKLFVGTKSTLFTLTFTNSDFSAYTTEHEWITGVIDDFPLQFAFDATNNALWMAESGAVHRLDTTGRWWRYGYHQGSPFGSISSVAVVDNYVYVGSSTGGLARMKTDTNVGQIDTLRNNQVTTMISITGTTTFDANEYGDNTDPWVWTFYGGQRYLPDNHVRTLIAVPASAREDGAGRNEKSTVVMVLTETGITYFESALFTLAQKAEVYLSFQSPRHDRDKLTHDCGLSVYGDLTTYYKKVGDNDGLWTAMHALGEAYAYGATGDERSRDLAWRAFEALEMLVNVTGDPKFPARSYCYLAHGDEGCGTGDGNDRWHNSTTHEGVMWKDDTSSDEMDGHFSALPVLYDLVAKSPEEKQRVYALLDGMMQGLVDNDLYLIDPTTNLPTTWGFWNPVDVNDNPEHYSERGLNSLSILGYLASAYSITRKPVYKDTFLSLVNDHGYVKNLMNVKIDNPGDDNHSDNELISLSYHIMFYSWQRVNAETEGAFKSDMWDMVSLAIPSFERTWLIIGAEFSPLWTGIYAGVAAQPASQSAITRSVWSLRKWALDLINWPIDHSGRWDLTVQPFLMRNSDTQKIMREIRPPQERVSAHWNGDPYTLNAGSGTSEYEPAVWRLPYYMMLFYKLI